MVMSLKPALSIRERSSRLSTRVNGPRAMAAASGLACFASASASATNPGLTRSWSPDSSAASRARSSARRRAPVTLRDLHADAPARLSADLLQPDPYGGESSLNRQAFPYPSAQQGFQALLVEPHDDLAVDLGDRRRHVAQLCQLD